MIVTLVVLALALAMLVVERLRPGRVFPTTRAWWARAIALNLLGVYDRTRRCPAG